MTTPKAISFLAGILLIGFTLSYIAQGAWFGSQDQALWASLSVLKKYDLGLFSVPWVNWDFFSKGLPSLFTFNFAFFDGQTNYFRYMLYVFSVGIVWGLVATVITIVAGFFTRR